MTLRRTETRLSVERELPGPDGPRRARLEARFESDPAQAPVGAEEVGEALRSLAAELDAAVARVAPAATAAGRGDRPLPELVEAYHPRQFELLDLLREEGEITPGEHALLHRYLSERGTGAIASAGEFPIVERPLAAAPLAVDRAPTTPRPVPELLALYRIESLKQAGAVRARRQISYEEYMALKRHFAGRDPADAPPAAPGPA